MRLREVTAILRALKAGEITRAMSEARIALVMKTTFCRASKRKVQNGTFNRLGT